MKIAHLVLLASLPLMACASSDNTAPADEDQGTDVSGASNDDLTSNAAAKLMKQTYKKTVTIAGGVKCTYDISWLTVTNLTATARAAVNTALYYGPKAPALTCEDPGLEAEGGYSKYSVNSGGVLSLAYGHYQMMNGAAHPDTFITPINLNLATGKYITLSQLVNADGKKTLLAACKATWKQITSTPDAADFAETEVCEGALTFDPQTAKSESFVIEKTGIRILIDNQLPHAIVALAGDGTLVTWDKLGAGLIKGSPVKTLAKR